MFSILANDGKVVHGQKNFIVDFETDITDLPASCSVGSTAFVIESSQYYMLNHYGQWIAVTLGSSGGGGGVLPEDHEVIYNGGTV